MVRGWLVYLLDCCFAFEDLRFIYLPAALYCSAAVVGVAATTHRAGITPHNSIIVFCSGMDGLVSRREGWLLTVPWVEF